MWFEGMEDLDRIDEQNEQKKSINKKTTTQRSSCYIMYCEVSSLQT